MGRRRKSPTEIISFRVNVNIKQTVMAYAKQTGLTTQEAYKRMIKKGGFKMLSPKTKKEISQEFCIW